MTRIYARLYITGIDIPARRRSGGTPDGGFVLEALARSGARSTAQGTYFNNAITKTENATRLRGREKPIMS